MKSLVAASLLVIAASASAGAAPVVLDPSPDAAARRVVNVVFAEYLQARVGAEVQTAVVDLDNDGVGEVIARFVHTGSCNEDLSRCRTAVVMYDRRQWTVVLDRAAGQLDFVPHDRKVPGALTVDGMAWKWGARRYEPDMADAGKAVSFAEVPAESAQAYAAAFGNGARAIASERWGVRLSYSVDRLSQADETVIVKMEGKVACGDMTGCPVRVMKKDGESWTTVLSTSTKGKLAMADAERGGYRDIIVQTAEGYDVLGWNGKGYSVADRIEAVKRER